MNYHEIIKKLIGPITPVGSASIDPDRAVNLSNTCELIQSLLTDVTNVAQMKDSNEHSVRRAAEEAEKFLQELSDYVPQPRLT